MNNFFIFRWLKNISLTRKLYFVVGIMAFLIAVELFTLSFMIHTISSTRAMVGAEGLWSKAEKDAVYSLTRYGYTHNEKDYQQYLKLLNVPLGDHKARIELFKPKPDMAVVREGFLQGRLNVNDIDGAVDLLRRFHNISYIKKAISTWTQGDQYIDQLEYLANNLHNQVAVAGISPNAKINETIEQIYEINTSLTLLEDDFSSTLGEGSRWVEHLVLGILFVIAMSVEFTGLFLTTSVSKTISKGINEIVRVASRVAQSDLSDRAKIYSHDEIGLLATAFNRMIGDLKKKMDEEKEAKNALHGQRDLYETLIRAQSDMGEGVCITDGEKIVYTNDALCKMYGYTRNEILNLSSFFQLVPEDEKLALIERQRQKISGERIQTSGETKVVRKDGATIDIEYTVRDLSTEGHRRTISIVRDVTEKNHAAELLRKAKARAESAEISKKIGEQFLANMSHEIRTPMNAIVGFTEILEKTTLEPEQREYLDAIKVSGDNLLVIINDILDFSRMRSGKLPIEKKDFKLSKIINTSIELLQPKAKKKGLRLYSIIESDVPDNLVGDYTRLMQVLLNLTANAIKFTEHGEVLVTVKKLETVNDSIRLQFIVKDTGIGIPEEQLETIFDAFTQVNNETARVYGGTGLGLAIVKQLAEIQGGSVSATSEPGKGSCFYYTIPYAIGKAIPEHKPEQNEGVKQGTIKDLHVLLAEDNVMNQMLAKKVITDWGWEVDIAENGEAAIELLKRKDFDVVLMDIQLPKMDGYQATKYIRNRLTTPKSKVPIIAMTACAMQGEQEKCLEAGMNGYVSKPFTTQTLYSNISKALKEAV